MHEMISRAAAIVPVREVTREISRNAVLGRQNEKDSKKSSNYKKKLSSQDKVKKAGITKIRPVNESDFKEAMKKVKRTGEAAQSFLQRENCSVNPPGSNGMGNGTVNLAQAMQMMNLMLSAANQSSKVDEEDEIPSIN